MTRPYKMPRTFKSPETRQKYIEGHVKGGATPNKEFTPESRQRQLDALYRGMLKRCNRTPIVAEDKETYTT